MTRLKLGPLVDNKPVRVVVDLPAEVHRDLLAYADALGRETGGKSRVEAAKLVAPMLARFMATDREFAKVRRAGRPAEINQSDLPARAESDVRSDEHG